MVITANNYAVLAESYCDCSSLKVCDWGFVMQLSSVKASTVHVQSLSDSNGWRPIIGMRR